jgi:hypothetical protein
MPNSESSSADGVHPVAHALEHLAETGPFGVLVTLGQRHAALER